jgi:DNA-binding NarL/FixJ family response regulator
MRILLVDDHSMVRSGLRLLLEEQDDFDVVGEAGNVEDALERTRRSSRT